jgi:hypothetical protein
MSEWAREHPESDIDEWAESMREAADNRRKDTRTIPLPLNETPRCQNCGRQCIGEFCRHCRDLEANW